MGMLDSAANSFGSGVGSAAGDFIGSIFGNRTVQNGWQVNAGKVTQQKVLAPEAINKLIYDVLSSDQGLAALAGAENASGGFGSSTKGLMAQDLVTKLVGELANITAPTVKTEDSTTTSQQSSKKKSSVICTELKEQGYLEVPLWLVGQARFQKINPIVYAGYVLWAKHVVKRMKRSKKLCEFFQPWAYAYYHHQLFGEKTLRSCTLTYLGHPLCFLIGAMVYEKETIYA